MTQLQKVKIARCFKMIQLNSHVHKYQLKIVYTSHKRILQQLQYWLKLHGIRVVLKMFSNKRSYEIKAVVITIMVTKYHWYIVGATSLHKVVWVQLVCFKFITLPWSIKMCSGGPSYTLANSVASYCFHVSLSAPR